MRKGLLSIFVLMCCCAVFFGCKKNSVSSATLHPYLTATVNDTSAFTAEIVVPSTVDTQTNDTTTALVISANSSYQYAFTDQIILQINRYKGAAGVFSIINTKNQAGAAFVHNGVVDYAASGVVAITQITSDRIIGYFSFTTLGGVPVTNGTYSVNKP